MTRFRHSIRFAAILFCCTLMTGACRGAHAVKRPPQAINGTLDLRTWEFGADGPVDLSGDYEFYWQRLLAPGDLTATKSSAPVEYRHVPGYWTVPDTTGRRRERFGFATYHLSVALPESAPALAVRLLEVATSCNLYVNGALAASVGKPGIDLAATLPGYGQRIVELPEGAAHLDLLLQVANFHHRRAGPWETIQLGRREDLRQIRERRLGFSLFLFGGIFIMSLYHLSLFALRPKDRSPLCFSLFCFLVALRPLVTGERFLLQIFPRLPWEALVKLEYLTFYLAVPAFAWFTQTIFPEFARRWLKLTAAVAGVFCLGVLFAPARQYTFTLNAYQLFTLAIAVYAFAVIFRSFEHKRAEAMVFLAGFSILLLATVNDILHVERIVATGFFAPFGLLAFILLQAALLSYRFALALKTVERQQIELKRTFESYKAEIIDRLKAEDALRASEEKYRTILHSIEDGYFEVDLAGNLTFFNDALCQVLGYPREELIGMNNRRFMHPETAAQVYTVFNRVFRTGRPAKALEWETLRKDGGTALIEASVSLMRDADGRPNGFRGVARDISERREAERRAKLQQLQLMRASKMVALGTLVSGVAHEINNPNNFITLNAPLLKAAWEQALPILNAYYETHGDFLLGGVPFSEMRASLPALIGGIADGAARISRIIDDLKNYVRDDTADMTQAVDVNAVLKSAVSLLDNMIRKATHHFHVTYGDGLPLLRGNFQRLEQVVINLLQNGCQALPAPTGSLSLATGYDRTADRVIISVRDQGVGIPADDLPHVTDPFFTTKYAAGGVGLGLSISAMIVEEHGGVLSFNSERGCGTTATVALPVERRQERTRT